MITLAVALLAAVTPEPVGLQPPGTQDVGIDEHLGAVVPLDLPFRDQDGRALTLRSLVDGRFPTILVPAYYDCPMLCGLVLKGVVDSLRLLDWKPGDQFRVVTFSIDPRDAPDNAAKKQHSVLAGADEKKLSSQWPFLVGRKPEISALTDALGFRYHFDTSTRQYAHPAAIVVLTPDGRISRYLYGVSFPTRDLKLALIEAGEGKSASSFARLILTCFRYDPASHRYAPYLAGFFRAGSALILLTLGLAFVRLRRREREGAAT